MSSPDAQNPRVQGALPKDFDPDSLASVRANVSVLLGRPVAAAWIEDGVIHVLVETHAASLVGAQMLIKFISPADAPMPSNFVAVKES